jgi:hypothetical protein
MLVYNVLARFLFGGVCTKIDFGGSRELSSMSLFGNVVIKEDIKGLFKNSRMYALGSVLTDCSVCMKLQ